MDAREIIDDYLKNARPSELTALARILAERSRQEAKWGVQSHSMVGWHLIASEELGEVAEAILEQRPTIDTEMVQVAAVGLAAVESHIRGISP